MVRRDNRPEDGRASVAYLSRSMGHLPKASGTPQTMTDVGGIQVTGSSYPAEIWATFMRQVRSHPAYRCPISNYPLPTTPVVWKPFWSAFTKYAPPPKTTTTPTTTTTTPTPAPKTTTTPTTPPPG